MLLILNLIFFSFQSQPISTTNNSNNSNNSNLNNNNNTSNNNNNNTNNNSNTNNNNNINCSNSSSPTAPTSNNNVTMTSTNSNNHNNVGNKGGYINYVPPPFPHILPHGQIIAAHPIVTAPPSTHLPLMATHQNVLGTPPPPPHPHMHPPPPPPPHQVLVNQPSPQPPPPNPTMTQPPPLHVQPTIISPNQNQSIIHGINQPMREQHNITPSHVQSHLPPHGVPHMHQQGMLKFFMDLKKSKLRLHFSSFVLEIGELVKNVFLLYFMAVY